MKLKRGIHRLYAEDSTTADHQLWGRKVDPVSRRGFLRGSGLAAMSAAVGASIPFAKYMPGGLIPAALAQSDEPFELPGKSGLTVLNDRPINAETPAHMLDDRITPASRLFVRNNGIPPVPADIDPDKWTLELAGESCVDAKTLTLAELKANFEQHTLQLQIECGGNGRSEFYPPARGNQWTTGSALPLSPPAGPARGPAPVSRSPLLPPAGTGMFAVPPPMPGGVGVRPPSTGSFPSRSSPPLSLGRSAVCRFCSKTGMETIN